MLPLAHPVETALAAAGSLGLAAGGYAYAGRWPTSQIFGPTLVAGSDWRELALTFDDGPNERYTQELLEYLANYKVRATFFMVGSYVRRLPGLARAVHAAGHLVGNHTMHHRNLMYQTASGARQEIAGCSRLLEDTLGAPVRYFRPPWGGRRPDTLRVVRELGLVPVLWNATGYDWRAGSPERIFANLRRSIQRNKRAGRGSNLLLHDGGPDGLGAGRARTVTVAPMLIHRLRREGYRFVTPDRWDGGSRQASVGIMGKGLSS
jgi:peptidoglycan/xylan/chitin deacetylase (PgdA/CDA1 family)